MTASNKSSDTKPASASQASAPAAPAVPAYISALPEGAKVFVLVPHDPLEQRPVQEQLDNALKQYLPEEPTTHHELRVARLPHGAYLFAAHCNKARAKREDGTYGLVPQIHIAGPIDLKQFTQSSGDGYTYNTDLGGIAQAVTRACKHANGVVWMAHLSGDPEPMDRVLKLSAV